MRAGKERLRMGRVAGATPRLVIEIPKVRRLVIIIDYDIEPRIEVFKMMKTARIDSYVVEHNGSPISGRVGWTNSANDCRCSSLGF
jgi:hypothetical protein